MGGEVVGVGGEVVGVGGEGVGVGSKVSRSGGEGSGVFNSFGNRVQRIAHTISGLFSKHKAI